MKALVDPLSPLGKRTVPESITRFFPTTAAQQPAAVQDRHDPVAELPEIRGGAWIVILIDEKIICGDAESLFQAAGNSRSQQAVRGRRRTEKFQPHLLLGNNEGLAEQSVPVGIAEGMEGQH